MNNPSVPVRAKSKYDELPRREIEGMIADGQFIIILDSKVLRLDAWIKFHPGGELAIKHMVGRDATDEINACVHPLSPMVYTYDYQWLTIADYTRRKPGSA